jgi:cytochrome c oxidase assembly protein subunit 15
MAVPRLSPPAYRRVALFALLALAFIVVTGAAVRLTGSGLGCTDWPTCEEGRLAPVDATDFHAMVEFVNRTITGLVSVAVMLAVLGSLVRRPRRRDLTLWSLGLVAGVIGQIVLGGLTVLFDLAPPFVMGHFILSMVLLWNAVVLHHRAGLPDGGRTEPLVSPTLLAMSRLLVASAAIVVFTGTVVTAAGPHAGDASARRLDATVADVARVHGTSVVILVGLTVFALRGASRERAPDVVQGALRTLLAVLVAQAGIGYVQYFTGVPAALVGAHVLGAVAVWVAVVRVALVVRGTVAPPVDERADGHLPRRAVLAAP